MRINKLMLAGCILAPLFSLAQYKSSLSANEWVDSVFKTLSKDQKIAQLMVIRAHSNLGADHVAKVTNDIKQYNIGALCFFQGGPVRQANLTNFYQSIAKTPLLVTIDGEWGLGMRLDSVTRYPYQLTLGALQDETSVYKMGIDVGEQCKRMGIQVNYAPVVDINNNPKNPVIGYRSFGEDKNKVALFGAAYAKGMQDAGIMACAKHFPGHGDVDVDSHFDLPVVNKSIAQLDSMELVPFRALVKAGVGSVMIAHLSIPAVDNTANRATSISKKAVTGLLRDSLGYNGLTFTDALEMKGVAKYFPGGTIAVEALIAGNDMLCLPADVAETIKAVKKAIKKRKLKWKDIDSKVKKVLLAKYQLGLNQSRPIDTNHLADDLNANTNQVRYEVASKTLTLLRNTTDAIPAVKGQKMAYVGIGLYGSNDFARRLREDWNTDNFYFSYKDSLQVADSILQAISKGGYNTVVIGISEYSLRPSNNYGISESALRLFRELQSQNAVTFVFGNVLALENFCSAKNLVACYQDDDITQQAAADLLQGRIQALGKLPVSVCDFKFGDGMMYEQVASKPTIPAYVPDSKMTVIDSIALDGVAQKAYPGCVVLAVHNGKIVYNKAFGYYDYTATQPMTTETIFDLASVTKVSATTVSLMHLYDEGKFRLDKTLGDYLPILRGTDKAKLRIDDILLHQAGLVAFISFYKQTIDSVTNIPDPKLYSNKLKPGFTIRVANGLYLRNDWEDTLMQRIIQSPVGPRNKYIYSDNDFILLGKVVEQITGMPLNEYAEQTFYRPMGMTTTGFKPRERFSVDQIAPTEDDKYFRHQLLRGDVHDEGSAMFGGVAGHAGLFSDAYDLSKLYQMLLDGGVYNGVRYLKAETIALFTAYHSDISRRGFGFDKPEKDNATRKEPYPSVGASLATFGHTGFTGTCVWVDPQSKLVYIFLSNRVNPTRGNKLGQLNIRPNIQDAFYKALSK